MNYRHAYHAGNFADVVKHSVLALVIEHLKRKETPFRVIDTHAGIGLYDLFAEPSEKTGEWRRGIGRIWGPEAEPVPAPVATLLEPYFLVIASLNVDGLLTLYPGSPLLSRRLIRPGDKIVASELHPEDAQQLAKLFARDRQTKVMALDGWVALKSLLPPRERRGVVLIDPPFEEPGELDRMARGLAEGGARFPNGIYLLWYPIKDPRPVAAFHRAVAASGFPKVLVAELTLRAMNDPERLNGCGLVIVNPPFQLDQSLSALLPFLAERLGEDDAARHRVWWLAQENDPKGSGGHSIRRTEPRKP